MLESFQFRGKNIDWNFPQKKHVIGSLNNQNIRSCNVCTTSALVAEQWFTARGISAGLLTIPQRDTWRWNWRKLFQCLKLKDAETWMKVQGLKWSSPFPYLSIASNSQLHIIFEWNVKIKLQQHEPTVNASQLKTSMLIPLLVNRTLLPEGL